METEGSIPSPLEPTTYPNPEPNQSILRYPAYFFKISSITNLLSKRTPYKWFLSIKFPHQNPISTGVLISP